MVVLSAIKMGNYYNCGYDWWSNRLTYAWSKKPIYKAELSFALQDEKSGGGLDSALGLASQFGIDLDGGGAGGEFSGDNLLELMKSRSIYCCL